MPDTASLNLFDEPPSLRWLPDETVYSIAARYTLASGIVTPSNTAKILFGYARGGFPHALPGGIGHFARAFNSVLGTPREIIVSHTVAPQLVVARSPDVREATYLAMEGAHTGTLKAKLGLLASGFGGALPLKACRACMDEDEQTNGLSYWHVSHQLPGTWICAKHAVLLDISMAMRSGQARYAWVLPKPGDLIKAWEKSEKPTQVEIQCLARLANASQWLLTVGRRGGVDLEPLSSLLWRRLCTVDLARRGRRLRPDQAAASFFQFFGPARAVPELERIAATPSIAYSQLLGVLNSHANGLHPLRIASIVAWLWPDTQDFVKQYDRNCNMTPQASDQKCEATHTGVNSERGKFLRLLESGMSISASARTVGVEVATGQTWAAAVGARVPRRPSLIRGDLRSRLVNALRHGVDKTKVASDFKISMSSVSRILRTENGLREAWMTVRLEKRRQVMRDGWTRALTGTGGLSKVARTVNPAAYAWLCRNDRTWLQCANRAQDRWRSNNSTVDWDHRDQKMSMSVLRIAETIHAANPRRIRLLDLLARLPSLKRNLRNLRRLPLTHQALTKIFDKRRESHDLDLFSNH